MLPATSAPVPSLHRLHASPGSDFRSLPRQSSSAGKPTGILADTAMTSRNKLSAWGVLTSAMRPISHYRRALGVEISRHDKKIPTLGVFLCNFREHILVDIAGH